MADRFEINDGILVKYYGIETNVVIPDGVTKIGDNAFAKLESLRSVVITDGVTAIGSWAFSRCKNLESVSIPDTVTEIGPYAFDSCEKLTRVNIPDGVAQISGSLFFCCKSLTSLRLPDSVTEICEHAFYECVCLMNIVIPGSVEKMGGAIFGKCYFVTVTCPRDSCAWNYCIERNITVKPLLPDRAEIPPEPKKTEPKKESPSGIGDIDDSGQREGSKNDKGKKPGFFERLFGKNKDK